MDAELMESLKGSAWRALKSEPAGLPLMSLARVLGVRSTHTWEAAAWLIENGHAAVRGGKIVAVGGE